MLTAAQDAQCARHAGHGEAAGDPTRLPDRTRLKAGDAPRSTRRAASRGSERGRESDMLRGFMIPLRLPPELQAESFRRQVGGAARGRQGATGRVGSIRADTGEA